MTGNICKIKACILSLLLTQLAGCLSVPDNKESDLFTYRPNNAPVIAIEMYGYLTEYDGCLQYRYKGQVATPIFPYAMSSWDKQSGTITVRDNTINLDELFSMGLGNMSFDDEFVTQADKRCLLADTMDIGSLSPYKEDVFTNPKYRYGDFKRPNIEAKVRTELFTYTKTVDQNNTTPLVTQTGSFDNINKGNCLYFIHGYDVATPVFPKGVIWNKDNQTITISDRTIDIGIGNEISLQTTGAIPANRQDFATVGDEDCLAALVIPIDSSIKRVKTRDKEVDLNYPIEFVAPIDRPTSLVH